MRNELKDTLHSHLDDKKSKVNFEEVWEQSNMEGSLARKNRVGYSRGRNNTMKISRKKWTFVLVAAIILSLGTGAFAEYLIRVDDMSYTFKMDEAVIGKWHTVGFVEKEKDFVAGQKLEIDDLFLRGLTFGENGEMTYTIQGVGENMQSFSSQEGWTKGHILDYEDQTNSAYSIKNIDGKEYMFFEWKSGDYTYGRFEKPYLYVLERGDAEPGMKPMKVDDITYNFEDDPEVLGSWKTVNYVKTEDEFKPDEKVDIKDLGLVGVIFKENGTFVMESYDKTHGDYSMTLTEAWTKGHIIRTEHKTNSAYFIKKIDGEDYLFYGLKDSNYIYKGEMPSYYVFKRES